MGKNGQAISTRNEPTDVVKFKVSLNGTAISGEYQVTSLSITKSYNKVSTAQLIIADGDAASQDFPISSKDAALVPGSEIEIALGYHAKTQTVFKGIITKHVIKSSKSKHSLLIIEAKDKAVRLTLTRKNHCFVNKTDKETIEDILKKSDFGGTFEIEDTPGQHSEMIQYNAADWDFIVSRAEMNGLVVLSDDNKLLIKKPDTTQEAIKEVTYGVDVIEFESEIDAMSQLQNVISHSWNYKDQVVEDSREAKSTYKETGNLKGETLAAALGAKEFHLFHSGNINKDELKLWSDAKLLKSRMAKAAGRIKVKGTTEITTGKVITLSGFGKRFNGNVLITGIRHNYSDTIWETDLQFGLPAQWFSQKDDIIEKPASGLIPGINGLQIGIVMQLENDPENQFRVKIKLPLVDSKDGFWVRIACLDAGNERGSFFRPEVNDEVVVGFLNDDPRHAIILGMLNSNGRPAAIEAKDVNHEKGFITRSKMKFVFNDDKKTLTIETPKGKKIEVNDDADSIVLSDQHNNKISMVKDGIIVDSARDIVLKAAAGDNKKNCHSFSLQ